MTENKTEFLRKSQFLLIMACAVNPIPLLLYVMMAPELLPFAWAFPLAYLLLAILALKVPGKFRLLYGIGGCAVLAGLGVLMMLNGSHWITLVVPALYAGVLMGSLPVAVWTGNKEISPFWFYTGAILHVGVFAFKFFYKAYNETSLDSIDLGLLISFFIMVILFMLSLTRINLNASANGRQKPSAFMWQKNLTLTAVFFGLAILIAMIPSIYKTLDAFFDWIVELIKRFFASIKIQHVINDMGSGEKVPPPTDQEGAGATLLSDILNILFLLCGTVLAIAIAIPILIKIYKAVVRFIKKLLSNTATYLSDASGDYEDEVTDLRGVLTKAKGPRFSSAEERSLPPQERIRYRYRRLKARHPEWEYGSTARENLSDAAAPLYEKARYSSHPITEEDAETFRTNTKRV